MNSPRGNRSGFRRILLVVAAWWVSALTLDCVAGQRGVPATEGILNFGQVDGRLYRGAQPGMLGLENLKRLGVVTVINLRMPDDAWGDEAATVQRLGMVYINVSLHGLGAPSDADVKRVLALIDSSTGPVFIHCEHGADRTGTIVACYRIRSLGWTTAQALAEARKYGLSNLQIGMKHYVQDFPTRLMPAGKTPR